MRRARLAIPSENRRLRRRERGYQAQVAAVERRFEDVLDALVPVSVALLLERDFNRLLEKILLGAKALCHADGGTLYLRTGDDRLQFAILHTDSLRLAMGGSTGQQIPYEPVPLYDASTGEPNHLNIAAHAAISGSTVNVADAYATAGFDFAGTRAFDRRTGYRSTSLLTIPLKDGQGCVIGVIQLLNAQDPESGRVIPFESARQRVVEALAALAGVALEAYLREQSLRQEIQQLRIEIDEAKREREAAEITTTDSFQQLRERARARRSRRGTPGERPEV